MNLTKTQKKILKNNLRILSISELAEKLGIAEKDLTDYLRQHLPKENFKKIVLKNVQPREDSQKTLKLMPLIKNNWKTFIFLTLLVIAVYFNSLNNEFLSDDIATIRDNPDIANLNPQGGISFIFNLRNTLLATTYRLFGLNPLFFRLTNVLCHLGSTLVLFVLMNLFFASPIPFFVAGIFAVHPFLTEGVTWISGGPYSISTFIILSAFFFYLKARKKKAVGLYLFSILLFYFALTQAAQAVVFAGIIVWYEIILGNIKLNWKKTLPFALMSAFWTLYLFGLLGKRITALQTSYYQEGGFYNPLTQIPISISSYLELLFWPMGLTLYHSELAFSRVEFILRVCALVGLTALFVYFYKKDKKVFFWLSFFIISLLPSLTPLKIAWITAERYAYMGSIGIFTVLAYFINALGRRLDNRKFPYIFLAIALPLLSIRTITRNSDWKNQDNLWLAAAKTSPSSPQNHNNLGDLYARNGEFDKAVEEFQAAIKLLPNYGDAYHNLANTYLQMGKPELARENYEQAIKANPNLWQSYQNLAVIHAENKDFATAITLLDKALSINPENPSLYFAKGIIFLNMGKVPEAKETLLKANSLDPENPKVKEVLENISSQN